MSRNLPTTMKPPAPPMPTMAKPFGPNDAQAIVSYLQKRVRVENLDEATALSSLIQSFVEFANRTFDEIAAKQRFKSEVKSAVANTDGDGTASD